MNVWVNARIKNGPPTFHTFAYGNFSSAEPRFYWKIPYESQSLERRMQMVYRIAKLIYLAVLDRKRKENRGDFRLFQLE